MEKDNFVIVTDRKTIASVVAEAVRQQNKQSIDSATEFEKDRLTQHQAALFIGISVPTLKKEIRAGKFKEYSIGAKKKYLLKSELLDALRNSNANL
ncbi:helix-turn-helix domain-containing protein [Draconibacterium sp.]|nr:helix-turn-helix domain-containing protein [Draconibacterium sp.]